jgi:hypothetical protein
MRPIKVRLDRVQIVSTRYRCLVGVTHFEPFYKGIAKRRTSRGCHRRSGSALRDSGPLCVECRQYRHKCVRPTVASNILLLPPGRRTSGRA